MKFLILLSVIALSWAQDRKECHCGIFATVNQAEIEVHRLPPIDLDSCEDEAACKMGCIEEWEYIFSNGGLHFTRPEGDQTLGDECCHNMAEQFHHPNLPPHELYGYYNMCNGPWIYDGETSKDLLCCKNGAYPGECEQP